MNGALGDDRYGRSSTERTVKGRSTSPSARPRARGLVDQHHVARQPTIGAEVLARRHALAFDADERRGERRIGREERVDVPVAGAHERHAIAFALDHEADERTLHPPGRQTAVHSPPQHRRHLVAVEPIDHAPCLGRVDQAVVETTGIGDRLLDRRLGDLVEHHPLHGHLRLEVLEEVPRDRLPLAVFVGGEVELVGVLQRRPQLLHDVLATIGELVGGLEPVVDIDGEALGRQVGDVPHRGAHVEGSAQETGDGLRLRG